MKKLLVLFSLLVVITLSGCADTPQGDYVTQEEFDLYKQELAEVQDYLDRMVWIGYMMPEQEPEANGVQAVYVSRLQFEYLASTEKDLLDKTKFPEYIWDENGDYISVNKLGNYLTRKYFDVGSQSVIGFQYKITFKPSSELSNEEIMLRLSLMIMELAEYDFYTLDSPELYIDISNGQTSYLKVRTSLLTTDKYTLHPSIFWDKLLDTQVFQFGYDSSQVEVLYNELTTEFDGYVLPNYK